MTGDGVGKEGMKPLQCFFAAPPGDGTLCLGIEGVKEVVVEKEELQPAEPKEHNVWDDVYTGDKPIQPSLGHVSMLQLTNLLVIKNL